MISGADRRGFEIPYKAAKEIVMKVFVSHATADRELASKFVDLLQLGIGIDRAQLFFSSYPGSIPNAEYFVQHILKELNDSQLVIAILSHAYLKSQFCLAEAGAALARKEHGDSEFYSLVVPPEQVSDLGGVLYARQTGYITDDGSLDELRRSSGRSCKLSLMIRRGAIRPAHS
jgi:TIR domain